MNKLFVKDLKKGFKISRIKIVINGATMKSVIKKIMNESNLGRTWKTFLNLLCMKLLIGFFRKPSIIANKYSKKNSSITTATPNDR